MLIGFDGSRAFTAQNTGTENYSLNLLKALARVDRKNRYRVYLRQFSDKKIDLSKLSKEFPNNFDFRVVGPNRLWTQIGLAAETWRAPVDLLFVPAHTLPVLRNYRVKTVVTIHDLGVEYLPQYHQFPQKYYIDLASKFAAFSSSRIIAVSKATAKDLKKRYGVSLSKIDVVYEGVDGKFFKKQGKVAVDRVKRKFNVDGEYFLYVGTVQPRKNLLFLIDTFNAYVKKNSMKLNSTKYNNVYLVIAGKMGWGWQPIIDRVSELKLEKKVIFTGYVASNELPSLYSGAKALLFPSLFEGFGLPLLEALSCGTRVIASDIEVAREVLEIVKTRGYKFSKNGKKRLNLRKLSKFEAMMLAKPTDSSKWVQLMDQTTSLQVNNVSNLQLPDWNDVAKGTMMVFNKAKGIK